LARIGLYRSDVVARRRTDSSNLGYALVLPPTPAAGHLRRRHSVENIGYGLAPARFLAFSWHLAIAARRTEYAHADPPSSDWTRVLIGTPSGWIAQHAGYAPYFWLTCFSNPGLNWCRL